MNRFTNFTCLLSILIYSACRNDHEATKSLQIIDVENNINKMEVINLSQFASDIHYIPLETIKDNYLLFIRGCTIFGDYMILTNLKQCFLYTKQGKFIRQIGKEGRGPGEYQFVNVVDFDSDTNIYMQSLYDLLEYRIDGTPINKVKNQFRPNNSIEEYLSSWILINDSLFFGHQPNSTGLNKTKALLMNKKAETIKSYKNYILFEREIVGGGGKEDFAHVYKFDNLIYYKEFYNDTLFYLDDQLNMIPKYIFNLGRYKEPTSGRAKFGSPTDEYITIPYVFQTDKYLFIHCKSNVHFTAKRLTPKTIILPDGRALGRVNGDFALCIYNKQTKYISFCKQTITDNPLFASGIYNDIDAGPRFFPTKQVNDSTMLMWIKADDFIKHVESEDFRNSVAKYPEKKKQLEDLANSLSNLDNPVLMFVTFKK